MKIKPIKTHKITIKDKDIFKILDKYIRTFRERSVLAVTSKIVSICEGRVVKKNQVDKEKLVRSEAEYYMKEQNKYGFTFTIKNNTLIPASGIDESNAAGLYVLWPKNPQDSANKIREYLCKRFGLKYVGVIITDSTITSPLRWGITGVSIAHSGLKALRDYIGKPDLFKRKLEATKASMVNGLAAAAVFEMGEGNEQTPFAVIDDLTRVEFQDRNPTKQELNALKIDMNTDLFAPFLKAVTWIKGGSFKSKRQS